MADEDETDQDPRDAEIRRLKSENDAQRRRIARLEAEVKVYSGEQARKRLQQRKLDRRAASPLNRPWDGR